MPPGVPSHHPRALPAVEPIMTRSFFMDVWRMEEVRDGYSRSAVLTATLSVPFTPAVADS
jgi:hypothetical protein